MEVAYGLLAARLNPDLAGLICVRALLHSPHRALESRIRRLVVNRTIYFFDLLLQDRCLFARGPDGLLLHANDSRTYIPSSCIPGSADAVYSSVQIHCDWGLSWDPFSP